MFFELLSQGASVAHSLFVQDRHISGRGRRRCSQDILEHILPRITGEVRVE
jgi:hypothetical protein